VTEPSGGRGNQLPAASAPNAVADAAAEPLEGLAWSWEAPLELIPGGPRPRDDWQLTQARRPVVSIEQTSAGASLRTVAERWDAVFRRRRRRLGWHIEVARAGEREPVLWYYPQTVRAGGALVYADHGRYKLRHASLMQPDWTLAAVPGGELARLKVWTKLPGEAASARAVRPGLRPAIAQQPNPALLLAAASLAVVIHHQQPSSSG